MQYFIHNDVMLT